MGESDMKIQRPWALVVGVLLLIYSFYLLTQTQVPVGAYGAGQIVGHFVFPAAFLFLAFKPKRNKDK
ncbi:hypothetical protein IV67_GL001074 [Weissella minor]|uniref:Uncharacterized protein n=2 Tax=Weissella minor TaxID=1620 RepID=A0A0R2JFA0_9LACO|nr:hypothetical protein IV67_GL001074 [Weissella minor]